MNIIPENIDFAKLAADPEFAALFDNLLKTVFAIGLKVYSSGIPEDELPTNEEVSLDGVAYHQLSPRVDWHGKEMIDYKKTLPENAIDGQIVKSEELLPIPAEDNEKYFGQPIKSFHGRAEIVTYIKDGLVFDTLLSYGDRVATYCHYNKEISTDNKIDLYHGPSARHLVAFLHKIRMHPDCTKDDLKEIVKTFKKNFSEDHKKWSEQWDVKIGDTIVLCSDPSKKCKVCGEYCVLHNNEKMSLNRWTKLVRENDEPIFTERLVAVEGDPRTLWERKFGNVCIGASESEDDEDADEEVSIDNIE